MIPATQIRVGNILNYEGELYRVLKTQHVTPGKGNAVMQTEMRSLNTGIKIDRRFNSSEKVDRVEVFDRKMQFLYQEGKVYHFMDPENYEQLEIQEDVLEEAIPFLKPETMITVSLYDNKPVGISLPSRVTLKIAQCDPASKGKAGATKEAVLENGNTVRVPLFLKEGDEIVVNTDDNSYMEKA